MISISHNTDEAAAVDDATSIAVAASASDAYPLKPHISLYIEV